MARDGDTTLDVHESFKESAVAEQGTVPEHVPGSGIENEPAKAVEAGADFETTTTVQVELEIERYDVLDAHDARWNRERDRITAKPEDAPSFDLGGDGRSIQREYTERRSQWEDHRDAINRMFDQQVAEVRALGTTMTDNFTNASGPAPEQGQNPAALPSNADASRHDDVNETTSERDTTFHVEFHRQVRKTTRSL